MDLTQNVKVVISGDAQPLQTATKQAEQTIKRSQSNMENVARTGGRRVGDSFGREMNTSANKWARMLGQTLGKYFGEWGSRMQDILYLSKDIREILPSRRQGGGGSSGAHTGGIIGADIGSDIAQTTITGRQIGKANAFYKATPKGFESGAVAAGAGAAGAGAAGMGLLASTGIGLGIAAVVTLTGVAVGKWMDWQEKIKDVSRELGVSKSIAKDFLKEWDRLGDQDGMLGSMTKFVQMLQKAREGSIALKDQLKSDFSITSDTTNEEAMRIVQGTLTGAKPGLETDKLALRAGISLEQLDEMRRKRNTELNQRYGSSGMPIYLPSPDYGDSAKRTVVATEANAIDASNKSLKEYSDAKKRADIKGKDELPLLMVEVNQLKQKIAQEKDIIKQNDLKKQLIDKELELKALANDATQKGIDEQNKAREDKMEADQKLLEKQTETLKDEAEKIAKANPNLYNSDTQSPSDIVALEAERLLNSTLSPSQLAWNRANDKTQWQPNKAIKELFEQSEKIGEIGSFKKQIQTAAQRAASMKIQNEANRLDQILSDYIRNGGAFNIIPHNGE